ncbi:MAG: stage 0 sporulation family protein [Clostridia bacterium]|nr:stage 0 sporulation family protein [Clostridia bacterium]
MSLDNKKSRFSKHHRHFSPHKGVVPRAQDNAAVQEAPKEAAPEAPADGQPGAALVSSVPEGCINDCPNCGRCIGSGESFRAEEAPLNDRTEPGSDPAEVKDQPGKTVTVVGVRFREAGKVYYFSPAGLSLTKDQSVIVETARGIECGTVAFTDRQVGVSHITSPLKKILRVATEQDLKKLSQLRVMEADARKIWDKKLSEHKLEMDLVDVEYTFDAQKLVFYFTADGRVDFREFVKDLANVFKTRIELRQIGVRDEAKQIGGLGVCGRPFCCKTFLDDFQQVSIKMAKEQNLSLNSVKISGTCGRLMCCLRYENDVYEEEARLTPKPDTIVMTPDGRGVVTDCDVLRGLCKVSLDSRQDLAPSVYSREVLKVLGRSPRGQRREEASNAEAGGDENND